MLGGCQVPWFPLYVRGSINSFYSQLTYNLRAGFQARSTPSSAPGDSLGRPWLVPRMVNNANGAVSIVTKRTIFGFRSLGPVCHALVTDSGVSH